MTVVCHCKFTRVELMEFVTAQACVFLVDDHCHLQCVTGQPCRQIFSQGHDPITQVREARFLIVVGDLL